MTDFKVYLEHLYHFNCYACNKWWSMSDKAYSVGLTVYCPHCGIAGTLPEKVKRAEIKS